MKILAVLFCLRGVFTCIPDDHEIMSTTKKPSYLLDNLSRTEGAINLGITKHVFYQY